MTPPTTEAMFPALVGRAAEASRLRSLAGRPADQGGALVILGEPGMGKSALLADTARRAAFAGTRVLAIAGAEAQAAVPFAGLRELTWPLADVISLLPARQAGVLGAIREGAAPAASDRLVTASGLLALLTEISRRSPVLVTVDDAHWLDRETLAALSFAAYRLESAPGAVLLASRGAVPPYGFEQGFPELPLPPLSPAEGGRLLDAQPIPPRGRARRQVLLQAAGNPAALIELSLAVAAGPGSWSPGAGQPLPLSIRLAGDVVRELATLSAATRHALLVAAVADDDEADGRAVAAYAARLPPDVFVPAERLGLVNVGPGIVRLTGPFVRSAVYHSATPGDRALAHRELAGLLGARLARQAWHLGAAATWPDERVAAALEAEAAGALGQGDALAAAAFGERAAELSSDPLARARRLADASAAAIPTGEADWTASLAARALAAGADQDHRAAAERAAGWARLWAGQPEAAAAMLTAVATSLADRDQAAAWTALADAACAGYLSGAPDVLAALAGALRRLDEYGRPGDDARHGDIAVLRLWTCLVCGVHHSPEEAEVLLRGAAAGTSDVVVLRTAGLSAWILDQTEVALRLFRKAGWTADAAAGPCDPLSAAGWAYLDAGRWRDALSLATAAREFQSDTVIADADLIAATIGAARGDPGARLEGLGARPGAVPAGSRAVAARAWHARGLAALSGRDDEMAYQRLRMLFGEDGSPLHPHVSYLGVADLAAACARTGRQSEGRELIKRADSRLGGFRPARLAMLLGHARALLAAAGGPAAAGTAPGSPGPAVPGDTDAESEFDAALSAPAGESWPFEQARLRLDYGEWLRRQRRISAAKSQLAGALDTFRSLRAAPWAREAEAELRACGVSAAKADTAAATLRELPPVQRQIILAAASGKTNREIAEEMFLSPRTVSSYLYLAFPKLGVSRRHQLRDVIGETAEKAG